VISRLKFTLRNLAIMTVTATIFVQIPTPIPTFFCECTMNGDIHRFALVLHLLPQIEGAQSHLQLVNP